MNKTTWVLCLLINLTIISACKKIPTASPDLVTSTELDLDKIDLDFDYLTTSSKIKFSNDEKNISANASIRIKKDSIIWISLSPGFGVEAARGKATQDSLIIINRLDNEYLAFDFKKLSEKFNFDITYDLLQAALLGNMPIDISQEDKVQKESAFFVIKQESGDVSINNYVNPGIMKVAKVEMREKNKNAGRDNTLFLQYDDFKDLDNQIIPFINLVSLNYRNGRNSQHTEINIEHKRASFSQEVLKFPFNIPDKYEQR